MNKEQTEDLEENKPDSGTPSVQSADNDKPQAITNTSTHAEKKKGKWTIGYTLTLISILLVIGFGINTAYQSRQQFLAANKPRLQMVNVHFDESSLSTQPTVVYQLVNLGNYPTEVTNAICRWTIGDYLDPKPWEKYEHKNVNTLMPFAISKERPFSGKIILLEADTNIVYIMKHVLNPFYLIGDYYYHDQIADKDMVYKVVVQVRLDGSFSYVINKNEPVP